jgi:TonB-dependent starch-binding outer membrane protein SusC
MKQKIFLSILLLFGFMQIMAQQRTITGTVTSKEGTPLSDASVVVVGQKIGARTGADGTFSINVPANAKQLQISYIGSETQKVDISSTSNVSVSLAISTQALTDVVVIGYGSVKKKDLTGSVTSIQAKDFNKGTYSSPDQLIQGKAAGVQMINSSGQPGGLSIVKVRGNATVTGTGQPLYVVDGVPLDGRSPRPGADVGFGGGNPGSNPLNFINPTDIASIDILKDASATAIYGSRAAYGVVLITTKKGKSGQSRIDFNESIGFSKIAKRLKVLDASQFRQALTYYGVDAAKNDHGASVDALDAILRTATVQNYNISMSGGNENGKYRLSLGVLDQEGIVRKSGIKKYSANFNTNLKFLESKRLSLDINILPSQYIEDIAPISNNAGAGGSLIGHALQWNPTQALVIKRPNLPDSFVDYKSNSIYNPLAVSEAVNDKSIVTTILASISPSFKFTDWLTYKFQYSINYASGIRRSSVANSVEVFNRRGFAGIGQNELSTEQFTHTLTFDKSIANNLSLNAVAGFEYLQYTNKGSNIRSTGQIGVPGGFGNYGLDYTNYIQYSDPLNRVISSFIDPTSELKSYFGRVVLNYREKYLLTGTFRRDGSTKFGGNYKYGNFPSVAAAWNVSKEDFFSVAFINSLKLRGGWGKTGNQEFPSGASQRKYIFQNGGSGGQQQVTNANPDLKWQSDRQYNIGLDVAVLKNKITATVDYFNKLTTDLLFPTVPIQPAPPGGVVTWKNIAGKIENKGLEASVNVSVIEKEKFSCDFGANATFLTNSVSGLSGVIQTGALSGQGSSGATVEVLKNGLPINAFYTRRFTGFDKASGLAVYPDGDIPSYVGDPNPKTLLGLNTTLRYQKLSLIINMYGNFGQKIYIETLNNVVNVGDIRGGRNIAVSVFKNPIKESFGNPVTSSSRYIEDANYLKMTNATLAYNFGNLAKTFQNVSIYATGQNLFTITKFQGFDPEVNVDKNVSGVPSVGIEYEPYPSARTITFGINFSL